MCVCVSTTCVGERVCRCVLCDCVSLRGWAGRCARPHVLGSVCVCLGAALRCVFYASACARVCRTCMPREGGGGHGTKAGLSARSEVAWGQVPLSAILSSHLTCRPAGPQFPSLMSEGFRQGPSQGPCSLDSGCGAHSAELGAQSRLWQSPAATPSVQKVGASAGP